MSYANSTVHTYIRGREQRDARRALGLYVCLVAPRRAEAARGAGSDRRAEVSAVYQRLCCISPQGWCDGRGQMA